VIRPPRGPKSPVQSAGYVCLAQTTTWLMYRYDGTAWAWQTRPSGIYYLDPGNPEVQSYTRRWCIRTCLRNYRRRRDPTSIRFGTTRAMRLRWGLQHPAERGLGFKPRASWPRPPPSQPAAEPIPSGSPGAADPGHRTCPPHLRPKPRRSKPQRRGHRRLSSTWGSRPPELPMTGNVSRHFRVRAPGLAWVARRGDRRLPGAHGLLP